MSDVYLCIGLAVVAGLLCTSAVKRSHAKYMLVCRTCSERLIVETMFPLFRPPGCPCLESMAGVHNGILALLKSYLKYPF